MAPEHDLSSLLQGWQPDPEISSRFNRAVWSRIEAAEVSRPNSLNSLHSFFSWVGLMARPRIATAAVAIALFGGVLIGGLQARSSQEGRYLLSLKPFEATSMLR